MTPTRAQATSQVRAVNAQDLTVDLIASTFALDSYNTRIDPAGCDYADFKRNPVICYGHDDRGFVAEGSGLPVARAMPETIRIQDGKLMMTVRFTPEDVNPFGYKVFRMVQAGFISGVSVGFDPTAWEDHEEAVDGANVMVRVYTKWRLVETSIVTIPANGEAMVVRAREMNREGDIEQFRTLAQEIEVEAKERTRRTAQTIDDVLLALDECPAKELIVKHRSYFDSKQKANKASTRFLAKLYKARNQDIPQDEVEAWNRAEGLIDTVTEAKEVKEEVAETPVETEATKVEITPEQEAPPVPEATPTEPSTTPEPEAPAPERKASVQVPLSSLSSLYRNIRETCVESAVEASRRGIPVRELTGVIDAVGQQFEGALISHP